MSRAGLLCIALSVIAGGAQAAVPSPELHHDIAVTLDPETGILVVRDRMEFQAPGPAGAAGRDFVLDAGLEPVAETEGVRLEAGERVAGREPLRRWLVHSDTPVRSLTIRYRGRLAQRAGNDPGRGHVGPEGVFLTGASGWYPRFGDERVGFTLAVTVPDGWTAVSQGRRIAPAARGTGAATWREDRPQDEIVLLANRFSSYALPAAGKEAQAYLRRPQPALAMRYLEATARYLDLYARLIGPYPYDKFALVENFWETGYGMPSLAVLGPRVLRLPFILHTSYPHEILHSWWGNSVYVDYAHGNWSEGLTAYLADHLLAESDGRGIDHRRAVLQRYRSYVGSGHDFALADFRGRHDEASQAVGYGKALMFFHMLRRRIGDPAFVDGLRRFYAAQVFRTAGYRELRAAFEQASGMDLEEEFAQWVTRVGAPRLRLGEPRVEPADDGLRLRARLEQVQAGGVYRLAVPVAVQVDGRDRAEWHTVDMPGPVVAIDLHLAARPRRLAVDPGFDLFRRLDAREIPPSLGEALGADDLLAVLPASADPSRIEAYRALASRLGARETVRDEALPGLPADRAVLVLGWRNARRPAVAALLARRGVDLGPQGVRIGATELSAGEECVVLVERGEQADARALAWIGCERPAAFAGLARKLPHYGRYGYLAFAGDAPDNTLQGEWRAAGSPLDAALDPDAPPLSLAPRPPLADLVGGVR